MHDLSRLGVEIIPFNTLPYLTHGWRVEQALAHRCRVGRGVRALNAALCQDNALFEFDVVWIDKGVWIYPSTLMHLKVRSLCQLAIHHTPDAHFADNRSRHFEKCLPLYELAVTTKPFELAAYRCHGAPRALLVLQGFGPNVTRDYGCLAGRSEFASDICFIGHCQLHYAMQLRMVASTGHDLRVWGSNWPRYARYRRWARTCVVGEGLWGNDYVCGLVSSRIALGLLSKRVPDTTTTRSFEIPASGTFMLAERTADHEALFAEGLEAEFFGCHDELRDKIAYYLRRDDLRRALAAGGRRRCLRSGYSALDQLRRVLAELADVLGVGKARGTAR